MESSGTGSAGIPIWSCCSQRSRPSRNGVAEAEQICYLAGCKLPEGHPCSSLRHCAIRAGKGGSPKWSPIRSEEHTSELQSLMRISYAVFCLKKTNHEASHSIHTSIF